MYNHFISRISMLFIMILIPLLLFAENPGLNDNKDLLQTPMRKGPYLIYPGTNTAMQILWQLYDTDTCTFEWGIDTTYAYGSLQTTEYSADHQHSFTIKRLVPGFKYHYRVGIGTEFFPGSFHAAPPDTATRVKYLAYGDTRSQPSWHNTVAAEIVNTFMTDPSFQSFILVVGDLVTNGDGEGDWDAEFFNPAYADIQKMLASAPYNSCMGNHEGSGQLFKKYFPYPFAMPPFRYWSFDYGPAHFVVVDQYGSYSPGSAQLQWIEDDLASTNKDWKFLYLHEPGWSAGGGHSNNTAVQNYIQPLCEQYGVSIVFAGHNHYYARAVVNGVQHITTGGGGAPRHYPEPGKPHIVFSAMEYHFCKIEIDGDALHFEASRTNGTVIDSFNMVLGVQGLDDFSQRGVPQGLILFPAYPNPFNPTSVISWQLAVGGQVKLSVYNLAGEKVAFLINERQPAGFHQAEFDGSTLASGIYLYRLQAGKQVMTRKMVLMK
jgi:hypothetical protein